MHKLDRTVHFCCIFKRKIRPYSFSWLLEASPVCDVATDLTEGDDVPVECSLSYRGQWAPVMTWTDNLDSALTVFNGTTNSVAEYGVTVSRFHDVITVLNSRCGKVMFSQASVILSTRGGGVHPPGRHSPWADTRWADIPLAGPTQLGRQPLQKPPQADPPRQTSPGQIPTQLRRHPPGQTPL